jgi:hypothetical protein
MLGLVISVLVSAAPGGMPSAGVSCADGPASCDAAWGAVADDSDADADADAGDGTLAARDYATPAVIECPSPVVPAVLQVMFGECDGTPRDAWYRVSRYPESEQGAGAFVTRGRERVRTSISTCSGLPPEGSDLLTPTGSPQPLATVALPDLLPPTAGWSATGAAIQVPTRTLDPPDRPPQV